MEDVHLFDSNQSMNIIALSIKTDGTLEIIGTFVTPVPGSPQSVITEKNIEVQG